MPADPVIAPAGPADAAAWRRLRDALWPGEPDDHDASIAAALDRPDADRLVLLAWSGGEALGLAEASVRREYVNGCDTAPVAFLEGLYVAEGARRRGVARALVARVAAWGRAAGCAEFASDAPLDNADSHALHAALGFAETERVVFYRQALV